MKVRLENVRLAFPELFQMKAVNPGDQPAYSATFLLPPNHPGVAAVRKAMQAAAKEAWGTKAKEIYAELVKKDRVCLRDGAEKAQKYDGFEGMLYVSARGKVRPTVVDQAKSPLTEQDGKLYAGCYVNGVVDIYAQDNQYGKRLNAQLGGVQFVRDGDAFGGGRPASVDDFDDVSDVGDAENDPFGDDGDDWDQASGSDLT